MSRIYESGCICPYTPCPYHANGEAPIKLTRVEEVQRNAVDNHDGTHTLCNRDYAFLLNEAILKNLPPPTKVKAR